MLLAHSEKGLTEGEKGKQSLRGRTQPENANKRRRNLGTSRAAANAGSAEVGDRCLQHTMSECKYLV